MFTLTYSSPPPTAFVNDKKLNTFGSNYQRNGEDADDTRGSRPEMATGHHFRQYSSSAAQHNASFKSASADDAASAVEAVTIQSDEPPAAVATTTRNVDEELYFTVTPTSSNYYYDSDANNNNNINNKEQHRNARRHHHHHPHDYQPTLPASFDWLQQSDDEPPIVAVTKKAQIPFGKMVYDYKQHRRYRRRVIQPPQTSSAKYRQSDNVSAPFRNKVDDSQYNARGADEDGVDDEDDFVVIAPPRGFESFYSRYVIHDGEQHGTKRDKQTAKHQRAGSAQYEDDLMPVIVQHKPTTARMMGVSTNPHTKRSGFAVNDNNKPSNTRYRHSAVQIPKSLPSNSYNGMATVYSGQTSAASNVVVRRTSPPVGPLATTTLHPSSFLSRPNFDAPISTFTISDLPLNECCSGFATQLLQLILVRVEQQQLIEHQQKSSSPYTKIIPTVRLFQAQLEDDSGPELPATLAPVRNSQIDYLTVQPTTPPTTFFHASSERSTAVTASNYSKSFIVKPEYNVHADGQFHLQWANWLRRQQRQVLHTLSQSNAADATTATETDKSHPQNTTSYMPHISGNLFTRREIRPWKDQIALLEPIVQSHLLTILPVQLVRRIEQLLLTGDGLDDLVQNNEKQIAGTSTKQTSPNNHWLRSAQRKFATMSSASDLVALQELLELRARKAYNIQLPSSHQRSETERRQARQQNERRQPVTILPNNRLNTYLLDINFVLVKHPLWPKLKVCVQTCFQTTNVSNRNVENFYTLTKKTENRKLAKSSQSHSQAECTQHIHTFNARRR